MKKLFLITLLFTALTSFVSAEMSMKKPDEAAAAAAEDAAPASKAASDAAAVTSVGAKPKKFVSTNALAIEEKHSPAEAAPEAAKEE